MGQAADFAHIPIIEVGDLVAGRPGQAAVAARLGEACRESGFFYVVGHGVNEDLLGRLHDLSREFPELGQSALYCVTEVHTKDDIDRLAAALEEVVA